MKFTISLLVLIFLTSCSTLNHSKIKFSKAEPIAEKNKSSFNDQMRSVDYEIEIKENIETSNDNLSDEIASNQNNQNVVIEANNEECDKMLLRSGEDLEVKIVEIGIEEIKYKKCNNLEGPTISILKKDVFMITYANGTKDVFKEEPKNEAVKNNTTEMKTEPIKPPFNSLAVASFIFGILGFIPIAGLILGIVASNQISKDPNRTRGKGLASIGIILSIMWIVLLLILLL